MYVGWTQVAFESELTDDVVPVDVGPRALIAVRGPSGFAVHDARCPHRGAHLGYGGRLDDSVVVCPFHGHRVELDPDRPAQFRVAGHCSVQAAGGLFVLLEEACETGLPNFLKTLQRSHHVVEAFSRPVAVPPEYVIENALDVDHFAAVHALDRRPRLQAREEPSGALRVDGSFDMAHPNKWQVGDSPDLPASARFSARVFSPTLVISELGSAEAPNVVITAASPTADGGCTVRITVALPRQRDVGPPTVRELSSLVSGSRTAFEQDAIIWEHLDTSVVPNYTESDDLVRTYRRFCRRFLSGHREPAPP